MEESVQYRINVVEHKSRVPYCWGKRITVDWCLCIFLYIIAFQLHKQPNKDEEKVPDSY